MSENQVFQCSSCPFYASYDRYGSKYHDESIDSSATTTTTSKKSVEPNFSINLNENVYLLRDPFVSIKENDKEDPKKIPSVIIGATCSVCSSPICLQTDCSIFYTRRFCLRCVARYREEFPREILDEIGEKRLEKYIAEEDVWNDVDQ